MAVMKTESRLPAGFAPEDLGQAAIKVLPYSEAIPELGDLFPGLITFALVSYLTSPLTQGTLNQYVVFVLDPDLAAKVVSHQWRVFKNSETGIAPLLISTTATDDGIFEFRPTDMGEYVIYLQLKDSSGMVIDSLQLNQSVIPFSDKFDDMVNGLSITINRWWNLKPNIEIGEASLTNELANDFYGYIQDAVAEPINGIDNQIPWQLLAAIAYREMSFAPKESLGGIYYDKPNRTTELAMYRNYLNDVAYFDYGVEDWSLGVCQIQPQTLATVLVNPLTQASYTPFLEEDIASNNGALLSDQRLKAFLALSLEDRVDLFNLLRFPRTHLRMCNLVLQALKNRVNRVPQLNAEQLLADQKSIQIIATEYNQGPTTTPWATVGENAYGREVYTIVTSPMIGAMTDLTNLVNSWWGVALDENGAPLDRKSVV